jgi:hypothetical protein
MHSLLINAFHIPMEVAAVACKEYFTRKWFSNEGFFHSNIKEGIMHYNDDKYLVVYHNCTPYQTRRANAIMCSFREAQDEFNLPAYVLIKIIDEKE